MNNPNTSEEAKQHSKEVLDNEYNGGDVDTSGDKNPQNVAGGLKAYVFPLIMAVLTVLTVYQYYQESEREPGSQGEC